MDLKINGQQRFLSLDPRTTLLDAIREHAGLMGTPRRAATMANAVPVQYMLMANVSSHA